MLKKIISPQTVCALRNIRFITLSHIRGSVTNNNGFWIGWLYLLSLLCTVSLNYKPSSAIADLHTFQFVVVHALGFSMSTSRLLTTDLNTGTITSNHYEVFLTLSAAANSGDSTQFSSDYCSLLLQLISIQLISGTHGVLSTTNSKSLYDRRFTANQFIFPSSPLRPTTRDFFFNWTLAVILLMYHPLWREVRLIPIYDSRYIDVTRTTQKTQLPLSRVGTFLPILCLAMDILLSRA
jgi:hypothetical protein